jgi:aryl-alcohol dehydrogenase-like predicted oxidoreductase
MLGTAQWSPGYGVARRAVAPPAGLLRAAWAQGIADLDTAPAYGEAEAAIGALVGAEPPHRFRICTKLPALGPDVSDPALAVREAVERSRKRLGQRIDAYLLHGAADLDRHGQPLVDALVAAQRAGLVESIGVSIYTPAEAFAVLRYPALSRVQLPFHLLDSRMVASGAVAALREAGVAIDVRSVFLQGLFMLSPARADARVPGASSWLRRLRALAERHSVAVAPLALAFARDRSGAQRVVVGVDSVAQLEETAAAFAAPVPLAALEEAAALFADVPDAIRDPRRWPSAPRRAAEGAS